MQIKAISKQIVLDETQQPVAVIIDYQDWQKIEAILQEHEQRENIEVNWDDSQALSAYAGCIHLTVDPIEYQHKIREEWS
jgi:tRNA U34 2-thiouridine synthase MnmA/TrmU